MQTDETPVQEVDVASRTDDELEDEIAELAAHIHAATYRLLLLIGEIDRRELWDHSNCRSTAHWLSWRIGLDLGAAREKVRVARALESLPRISDALMRGKISYSKARAVTRIATPETEEDLLNLAEAGTASHVEKVVRLYRTVSRPDDIELAEELHDERSLTTYVDSGGSLVINGRLPPEQGALLMKAIEVAEDVLYKRDNSASPDSVADVSAETRQADALALVAQASLSDGLETVGHSDCHQVVVHVDASVLADAHAQGRCEIEGISSVPAQTCRRLACDASVVPMLTGPKGEPLSVGRKRRTIPPGIRRALHDRDKRCRYPGCACTRFLQAHHIDHWMDGGETSLGNLAQLCGPHHRSLHEGGFRVELTSDGALVFFDRWDRPIPEVPELPAVSDDPLQSMRARHREGGLEITPDTCLPHWDGERMTARDYGWVVEDLLDANERWAQQQSRS